MHATIYEPVTLDGPWGTFPAVVPVRHGRVGVNRYGQLKCLILNDRFRIPPVCFVHVDELRPGDYTLVCGLGDLPTGRRTAYATLPPSEDSPRPARRRHLERHANPRPPRSRARERSHGEDAGATVDHHWTPPRPRPQAPRHSGFESTSELVARIRSQGARPTADLCSCEASAHPVHGCCRLCGDWSS
jgi:hypothetical protein